MRRWSFLVAGVSMAMGAVGCGSTSSPTDATVGDAGGNEAATEGGTGGDGAVNDAATDGAVGSDIVSPTDVQGLQDVTVPDDTNASDGANPGDATNGSLAGTWRLVRWDSTTAQGTSSFTDTNMQVPNTTFQARFNGYLVISDDRVAFDIGLLLNDHFAIDATKAPGTEYPSYGVTAPGTLNGDTFQITGGTSVSWTRNADGTITQVDTGTPGQTNRITWARIPTPQGASDFSAATGLAVRLNDAAGADAGGPPALVNPRVALAWDMPNSAAVLTTNDNPLSFVGANSAYAIFNASASEAPAGTQSIVGSTTLSLAYVIVYEDTNNNMMFDAPSAGGAGDTLRGFSPVAIANVQGPSSAAFQTSRFRDLYTGWQYVHLQQDYYVPVQVGTEPFDPTHPVSPDVSVEPTAINFPIPDLL